MKSKKGTVAAIAVIIVLVGIVCIGRSEILMHRDMSARF